MYRGFLLIEFFVVFTFIFLVNGLTYSADVTVSTALTTSGDEIIMGNNDTEVHYFCKLLIYCKSKLVVILVFIGSPNTNFNFDSGKVFKTIPISSVL